MEQNLSFVAGRERVVLPYFTLLYLLCTAPRPLFFFCVDYTRRDKVSSSVIRES